MNNTAGMTNEESKTFIQTLEKRFKDNMHRHPYMTWENVFERLEKRPAQLSTLYQMEETLGQPDVIAFDEEKDKYIFCDCAKESTQGRRRTCYDQAARLKRKKYPPQSSAQELAKQMGLEIIDETVYRYLQSLEDVDLKTSSWLQTPEEIRKLGGAIFADKRYNTVFVYHNSADSYYASRAFRGMVYL